MKKHLIYISPDETSFTQKDIEFLSKRYEVITLPLPWADNNRIILNFLHQFFFLVRTLPNSAATIIMFGGYWSFLPALLGKLLNKTVYIILGGADCVSFPEYNYGSLRKPVLRRIIKWSYMLADRLLPVAESLVRTDYNYDPAVKIKKQGFLNIFPDLKTSYSVIYNGFDANFWQPQGTTKYPVHFITIAKVKDQTRLKVKGIDMVIRIARHFPEHYFHIVGMDKNFAKSLGELPGNFVIHDFLGSEQVKELLCKSRFYLQLSISEGFPNALCEAMLCECIPICSQVGGMPFILQDSGILIETRNFDRIVYQISEIIDRSPEYLKNLGKKARMNIVTRFPIEKRENTFFELLDNEKG